MPAYAGLTPMAGLAIETRVAANARPKFRLSANASVTIGVDLSLDNIVVHQPTLDAAGLMSSVFDALAG